MQLYKIPAHHNVRPWTRYQKFARDLVKDVLAETATLCACPDDTHKLVAWTNKDADKTDWLSLDLTPFKAVPQTATAGVFFRQVEDLKSLLSAWRWARVSLLFEDDLPHARDHVHNYAGKFMDQLFLQAVDHVSDGDACLIGNWVSELDLYTAVKAVESLLNSRADLLLLKIAPQYGWSVHFDHLAIRCGSQARGDAERVCKNLCVSHGYDYSQVPGEDVYQFQDGWNARLLYKMLNNGQILRLFIDQSDASNREQIIQHWNYVYGYTAHHLALRATRILSNQRVAVSLPELSAAMRKEGVEVMTPTGNYTGGLLEQVFTRPEKNTAIPEEIKQELQSQLPGLDQVIGNGKLLELLSRREMKPAFAEQFYHLYGLEFDLENPLHSAPVFNYFLPAQAAHVIRTSQVLDPA